jgi:acyl-CoA synthetase (AMP-forming)/AMP-acid ligase II
LKAKCKLSNPGNTSLLKNSGILPATLASFAENSFKEVASFRLAGISHDSKGFVSKLTEVNDVIPVKKSGGIEEKLLVCKRRTWRELNPDKLGNDPVKLLDMTSNLVN